MTERLTSGCPEMGKKFCRKRLRHSNFPLRIAAKLPRKTPEELKLSRQDLLIELIVSRTAWRHLVSAAAVSCRLVISCQVATCRNHGDDRKPDDSPRRNRNLTRKQSFR
ncbi:hypothetical protein CDAR_414361 [Caerostris darwini]|uniref:Uncharacterized protein n=1 Tax=Caerostris darwini TaxID=1538125 RepID=A0AAV4RAK8_9ARAC|nr:hypothetical protein CDAR_414361 [Caerostris darwini]